METTVKNKGLWLALTLILFGASMRLLPHPANFAPIGAIALFGGMMLPKRFAWWLPLPIMMLSDMFLGYYSSLPFTWAAFLLVGLLGFYLQRYQHWLRIPFGAVTGSIIFFVISNFGVWVVSGLYAHTLSGLQQCFAMALPFFRATATSDILYTILLFYSAHTH
jgi:hypothetical protein